MLGASLEVNRSDSFIWHAVNGSSFEAVSVSFTRAHGGTKGQTVVLERFLSVLEQSGNEHNDPFSGDESFVVTISGQVQRYPGLPLRRGERLVAVAGCVVTHVPLRLLLRLFKLLVERQSFSAVFTEDMRWGVPERKPSSPVRNPFHEFMSTLEEEKHATSVFNEVLVKCLQFLEVYGLAYDDLFLTSLNSDHCSVEEQEELYELLVRLSLPENRIAVGLASILLPCQRRHMEIVCRVICLVLRKAFQPKPIATSDQDLFLGYGEDLNDCADEKESFKQVWRNCNNSHTLLALLAFITRIGHVDDDVNEGQLHFCCMAAPYLMDLPDPNMLRKLAKEGLPYMTDLDRVSSSRSPDMIAWSTLNAFVDILTKDLTFLSDNPQFFLHHDPVELFQASVWRTSDREIWVDSKQVTKLCAKLCGIEEGTDVGTTTENILSVLDQFNAIDIEARCLLCATALPQMLFDVNDEPLVPPFLYDCFTIAASTLHDQVVFNYLLFKLLQSIPLARRESLQRLVSCLVVSSTMRGDRDAASMESIAKRFGTCVLRPRLTNNTDQVAEIESLHAHRQAITRVMLSLCTFKDYFFSERDRRLPESFATIHERFKAEA